MKNEQWVFDEENGRVETDAKKVVAFIAGGKSTESVWRGELIAIAPDHALFGSPSREAFSDGKPSRKAGSAGNCASAGSATPPNWIRSECRVSMMRCALHSLQK